MDDTTKKALVREYAENDAAATDAVCAEYLALAEEKMLSRLYPFGVPENAGVPERYERSQCELAARLFLRRGGQGELAHTENGVARTYGSVNDEDILSRLVPFARV